MAKSSAVKPKAVSHLQECRKEGCKPPGVSNFLFPMKTPLNLTESCSCQRARPAPCWQSGLRSVMHISDLRSTPCP